MHESVDWQEGEEIVIAPTSYESYEAEVRSIASIDNSNINNPVITLNASLSFKHYAGI